MILQKKIHGIAIFMSSMLLSNYASAASFDCTKAATKVERTICSNPELSRLDDEMGISYKKALKYAADVDPIRKEQRGWLKARNQCKDEVCLVAIYKHRLKGLTYYHPYKFDREEWVAEREATIKRVMSEKNFHIYPGTPSNTPFCHQLMSDLKSLNQMEVVAPTIIAIGEHDPELRALFSKECGREYKTYWGWKQPRKIELYHVDIDNNPENGVELLEGDHYVKGVAPQWGKEYLVKNEYRNLPCKERGGGSVSGSGLALCT